MAARTGKDALLLWCQGRTTNYAGVKITGLIVVLFENVQLEGHDSIDITIRL